MSTTLVGRGTGGYNPNLGELGGIPQEERVPVMRQQLLPGEEAISLPTAPVAQGPLTSLTSFLGPILTVANPAWSGDPVPRMRALQKALVEQSLALPDNDRTELMQAINVVESAVQLRLRLQQMRMSEAEMRIKDDEEKAA